MDEGSAPQGGTGAGIGHYWKTAGALGILALVVPIVVAYSGSTGSGAGTASLPPVPQTAPPTSSPAPVTTPVSTTNVQPPPVVETSPQPPQQGAVSAQTSPTIVISPTSGPVGQPIRVDGSGFRALATIAVGSVLENVEPTMSQSDADGRFAVTVTVPYWCNGVPFQLFAMDMVTEESADAVYTVSEGGVC